MDPGIVALIGSGLLFIGSVTGYILNRRESLARAKNFDIEAMQKFQDLIGKLQDRNSELSDKMMACERIEEKLRNDLATALVEIAGLKTLNAKQEGYIQGITNPMIKLEEQQYKELHGGRRSMDK